MMDIILPKLNAKYVVELCEDREKQTLYADGGVVLT